jgi:TonB family protein
MRKCFFLLSVLLLTAAAGAQTAETPQSSGTAQTAPVYSKSNDGFRSQLDDIVRCYRTGDTTTGHHLIDQLRLPHPEEWFTEHLGAEQSAKLPERYDRLFTSFAESLEKTVEAVVASRAAEFVAGVEDGKGEDASGVRRPDAKLSGVVSIKQPNLFYGKFKINVKKKDSISWAETFVHEDGAFRFLGFGGLPFWVWQDGAEGGAPKGGWFYEPAVLISTVPPRYPSDAKARGIQGIVTIRVLVDKEGRVKSADVVSGDPLLRQAALDAVRQWRYKPSTLGGAPAEAEVTANVSFTMR